MKTNSLGFIGGGRITRIFLRAFANVNTEFNSVVVYDTNPEVLDELKKQFPEVGIAGDVYEAASHQTVIIALHPPVIMQTLETIKESVPAGSLVLSLAPKITIEKMASRLKTVNIARMIPNATSFINQGYNPVCYGSEFDTEEKAAMQKLLGILGTTFEVDEPKLEAYALLSAMLPTYFWFQWKELIQLGSMMKLTQAESTESVEQTLIAAIQLMFRSELSPEQLMDLIPVKPLGENEIGICEIYRSKLLELYQKIKP